MTEKEKQYLKAKIGELQEEAFDRNMNFLSSYHEGGYNALCKVENIIASMQEEPVSEKKCILTKDSYTDEDRKVLCKDCDEKCEYSKKEEPVDEDFLSLVDKEARELWKEINSGNDFSIVDSFNQFYGICMQVAESTVEWQKNLQEPVSNALEEELDKYIKDNFTIDKEQLDKFGIEEKDYMYSMDKSDILTMVRYFTNLQKEADIKIITDVAAVAFANGMAQMRKQIEEPVSEELEEAMQHNAPDNIGIDDLLYWRNGFITGAKWQKEKDESITEDLGEYINELSKQFPEVSFAKLSRIAIRVAQWQKEASDLSFFLKTLKPQPKQEWNEEDKAILEKCVGAVKSSCYSHSFKLEAENWLKSLRPQTYNTSEEDLAQAKKDAYNDALDKIEYHSGEPTFDDGWSAAIWYLKKRNAQPQNTWKPSESDIIILEQVIGGTVNPINYQATLHAILEQLKKLREK